MNHNLLENLPPEPLSPEEEQRIGEMLSKKQSKPARSALLEKLVMHSMREAFLYARSCSRAGIDSDEVYSLCYSALCRAAENFKPRRIRFFGYAKVFIRGEISREWAKKSLVRNVPNDKVELLSQKDVNQSFFDEENSTKRQGNAPEEGRVTAPDFRSLEARELWKAMAPLINTKLAPDERVVIMMIYKQDLTFREIATLLGKTKQWAQRLHADALLKLRSAIVRNGKIV